MSHPAACADPLYDQFGEVFAHNAIRHAALREAAGLARARAERHNLLYVEQRNAQMLESALYHLTQATALERFAEELDAKAEER